jgi:esterase
MPSAGIHHLCMFTSALRALFLGGTHMTNLKLPRRKFLRLAAGAAALPALPGIGLAQSALTWTLPEGVKSIEVNGYHMAYRDEGSGAPLVLVHGAVNDYRVWAGQVPEFAEKYRVIAVSLRHYYPERWNGVGDDFSIEQHIKDVAAFISRMNVGKVHLLGHSRGGSVVLNVAKRHPELIRTLILEDASGLEMLLPDTPENQRLAAEGLAVREALAKALARGDIDAGVNAYIDSLSGPGAHLRIPPERRQIVLDNIGTALKTEGRPPTTCAELTTLNFPVLLMNGERSPARYPAMYAAMRRCRDFPVPVVIPGAAHNMHRDNPAAFNSAVLKFLASH